MGFNDSFDSIWPDIGKKVDLMKSCFFFLFWRLKMFSSLVWFGWLVGLMAQELMQAT